MKTLSFVYVEKYKNLENVGVGLNNKYVFEYDAANRVLTIDRNKDYIPCFWGDSIHSFSAIMGNNGAGKSNLIRFIIENVIEGRNGDNPNGFIIWENDGTWHCFPEKRELRIRWADGRGIQFSNHQYRADIKTYFYTSHLLLNDNDILCQELSGMANKADGFLLRHSITDYLNKDEREALPFHVHARCYNTQSQMMVALFAAFHYNVLNESGIHVPRYVLLVPNTSTIISHNLRCPEEDKIKYDTFQLQPHYEYKTSMVMMKVIYNSLVAYSIEKRNEVPRELPFVLANEPEVVKDLDTDGLLEYIKEKYKRVSAEYIIRLQGVCRCIEHLFTPAETHFFLDISKPEVANQLASFVKDSYEPKEFLTARHYDMSLSDEYFNYTPMSSGESLMFHLFSRLFEAQFFKPIKFGNVEPCELIILDEAELGLHPEWQRNYIDMLVTVLNNGLLSPRPLQVIITSHSPIILSDIPKQNVVYVKKGIDGQTKVCEEQEETFASNVFDLYRNSFFLEDGLIGEYAAKKLSEIDDAIVEGRDLTESQKKTVEQIGDKRLRKYFRRQIDIDSRIAALNEEIESLKELKAKQDVQD